MVQQNRFIRQVVLIGVSVLLSACLSNEMMNSLDDTLRAYEKTVRWGNYQDILRFTKTDLMQYQQQAKKLESIRVTDYKEKHRVYSDKTDQLIQLVEISYYNERNNRVKTIDNKQTWTYDRDLHRWILSSGLPIYD